jgi:hypothetical protein
LILLENFQDEMTLLARAAPAQQLSGCALALIPDAEIYLTDFCASQ